MAEQTQQYPISHEAWSKPLMAAFGGAKSTVDVTADELVVKFGIMFSTRVPRSAITGAVPEPRRTFSKGAHGWRGRWLVNGSAKGLVRITIEPRQRAYVTGFPVRLRELIVSVDDPGGLITALGY
jgi:hypothetical protein